VKNKMEISKEIREVKEVRDVLGRKHNELVDERNNTLDRIEKALKVYEGLDNAMTPCSSVVDLLTLIKDALLIPRKQEQPEENTT
jgi:hypothetical protein